MMPCSIVRRFPLSIRLFGLLLVLAARADVVINEIYYDPPDRTEQSQFIELHNTGVTVVDLANWRFSDGVEYVFGPDTIVAAQGYIVVARNPATCRTRFGVTAFGPWTGSLSKSGETVELRDAAGRVIDQVDYQAGFPWPTAPRGAGASMELMNPALDNSVSGSWRGSQAASAPASIVYVPAGSAGWRLRKGTSEASSPVDAWRKTDFIEDGTWANGKTSIGYGDADDSTELPDMQNNYTSLFLRHAFTATAATMPTQLVVRVRVDDGCVVWLNGVEVARLHVAAGVPAFNGVGQDHEATATPEEVLIPNAKSLLRAGTNILAVQAFNASLASSDVSIDVELRAPDLATTAGTPTPGRRNSVFVTNAPPAIRQVRHLPEQPKSGASVVISALVTAPGGVKEVTLLHQVVEPGAYLRKTAPAYETNWATVVMRDDGANGDLAAGDGVFSATLPAAMQTHRRLVRYRLGAVSANDVSVTVPYADDESPNFAYFVYDGAPAWRGANRPGVAGADGVVKEFPASLMTNLPTYHLLANESDVLNSQYSGGFDGVRMWGTLVYDGKVYDHIRFNNRGEASTYVSGKNKWRFHFNRARDFEPRDNWGRKYKETWSALNLNGCSSPWSGVNRGMSGLDEALSFRVYELLGVPSPRTHHVHFRVVDRAAETSTTSQYESDLWGLYMAIEQPDGSFLDERGLPDGNVYKIEGGGGDKKHQGATQPVSATDWNQFASASGGAQTETWWRTNMDVNAYYSFHAGNRVVGNIDLREGWNHYFYHRADGRWVPVPWDLDMQFSAKTHWSGTIAQKNVLSVANLRIEFKNRCREILDLLLSDPAPDGGQIGQLIDEYADLVYTPDNPLNWVELDKCMWNWNPRTPGNGAASGQGNHKGNFFRTPFTDERIGGTWIRTLASPDFPGFLRFLLEYCTDTFTGATWAPNNGNQKGYGYRFLASDAADTLIPEQPVITYLGPASYPADQLRFGVSAFSDPQGSNTFSAIQWRIAEIIAPGMASYVANEPRRYEIETTWTSGEISRFEPETRVPAGVAGAGRTYRARCRMKDTTGRWSRWSRPVQFVAGTPDITRWQRDLQLTEIMYNPPAVSASELAAGYGNDDFEYLELANVGTETLDLTNVRVVQGVDAAFPAGTQLAPGAFAILARNPVAFALRHGTNIPVVASFAGDNLRNEGEAIRIVFGEDTTLISLAYGNKAPWPEAANGKGASLELISPEARPDPANPANWRASTIAGGSPGRGGGSTYALWAAGRPALADPRADADGDQTPNWIEYAFGTDPLVANPASALKVEWRAVDGGPAEPLVRWQRRAALDDVSVVLELSRDLVIWNVAGERAQTAANPDGVITEWWRLGGETRQTGGFFARLRLMPGF